MSGLDQVRATIRSIEARFAASDWDALAALEVGEPQLDVGEDVESMTEVLREVEELQHRIEVAMGAIREELDGVPQMRKAARAYGSLA